MFGSDDMGRDEGKETGPEPGKGAVVHYFSGEADFDGLPGDELPSWEAVRQKLWADEPDRCARSHRSVRASVMSSNRRGSTAPMGTSPVTT
jgi:hypothetical protein